MTQTAFLAAYRAALQRLYPWAADESKLQRFLDAAAATIGNGESLWNFTGDAVNAAWREIGGRGVPTLKDLRSLPSSSASA